MDPPHASRMPNAALNSTPSQFTSYKNSFSAERKTYQATLSISFTLLTILKSATSSEWPKTLLLCQFLQRFRAPFQRARTRVSSTRTRALYQGPPLRTRLMSRAMGCLVHDKFLLNHTYRMLQKSRRIVLAHWYFRGSLLLFIMGNWPKQDVVPKRYYPLHCGQPKELISYFF